MRTLNRFLLITVASLLTACAVPIQTHTQTPSPSPQTTSTETATLTPTVEPTAIGGSDKLLITHYVDYPEGILELISYDLTTGKETILAAIPFEDLLTYRSETKKQYINGFFVSPDGENLLVQTAYEIVNGNVFTSIYQLYLVPLENPIPISITNHVNDRSLGEENPSWSADGTKVVFSSGRDMLIWEISDTTQNFRHVFRREEGGDWSSFSWNPSRDLIAFQHYRSHSNIYQLTIGEEQALAITDTRLPIFYKDVQWSPTGEDLFYLLHNGNEMTAGIFNLDSNAHVHSSTSYMGTFILDRFWSHWSPDGEWVVYESNASDPQPAKCGDACQNNLFILSRDGSESVRITSHTEFTRISQVIWSPDSSAILYTTYDFDKEMYVYRILDLEGNLLREFEYPGIGIIFSGSPIDWNS